MAGQRLLTPRRLVEIQPGAPMSKKTPEDQATGRYRLVISAKMAKLDGFSMQEWLDNEDVLDCCDSYNLDRSILEHICYWVWKPLKR